MLARLLRPRSLNLKTPILCALRTSTLRMASTFPRLPIFEAIAAHDPSSTAVVHSDSGRTFTYGQLVSNVARAAEELRREQGARRVDGERFAFLAENGFDYVGAESSSHSSLKAQTDFASDAVIHIREQCNCCPHVACFSRI